MLLHPPDADAWLGERRADLADLCRYAVEERFARTHGDAYLAEELRTYVNAQAERLLEEIGEARVVRPSLIGIDG